MAQKGISFTSKQIGINEFYDVNDLQGKTFGDIAEHLYTHLLQTTDAIKRVMESRRGLINKESRVGLVKFFYLKDGQETSIPQAKNVMEFYISTGVSEVIFFVDVIGGTPVVDSPSAAEDYSHHLFLHDAKQILADPRIYGQWNVKEFEVNRYRLFKTMMDKYRRTITVILQPNIGYPRRPPRVVTIPQHRDPCFSRGELDWTVVADTQKFVWEQYQTHSNPLVYLLEELKKKYGLVF